MPKEDIVENKQYVSTDEARELLDNFKESVKRLANRKFCLGWDVPAEL